jgi:hypothetical protein
VVSGAALLARLAGGRGLIGRVPGAVNNCYADNGGLSSRGKMVRNTILLNCCLKF